MSSSVWAFSGCVTLSEQRVPLNTSAGGVEKNESGGSASRAMGLAESSTCHGGMEKTSRPQSWCCYGMASPWLPCWVMATTHSVGRKTCATADGVFWLLEGTCRGNQHTGMLGGGSG